MTHYFTNDDNIKNRVVSMKKGIINNINKKLLAGTLSLTIVSTCLVGCIENDFDKIQQKHTDYLLRMVDDNLGLNE